MKIWSPFQVVFSPEAEVPPQAEVPQLIQPQVSVSLIDCDAAVPKRQHSVPAACNGSTNQEHPSSISPLVAVANLFSISLFAELIHIKWTNHSRQTIRRIQIPMLLLKARVTHGT
jgi:hypothetical protein